MKKIPTDELKAQKDLELIQEYVEISAEEVEHLKCAIEFLQKLFNI